PIQRSIANGEAEVGITTMLMDAGMDTGSMLLKTSIPIQLLDNAHQLGETLSTVGADLLVETLVKLERQEIQPISQDSAQATYAPLIQKQDYYLNWSHKAIDLHNQIRGFFPDCVAKFRNQMLKITATAPIGADYWSALPPNLQALEDNWSSLSSLEGKAGEVVSIAKKLGPIVQTGEGLLLLLEVQMAGKRIQSGWDFVNGMRLSVREVLEGFEEG
ncbi:MAG TPA: formyltransferase family protein, partial [Candidatus Sericytochromatia bacterium]